MTDPDRLERAARAAHRQNVESLAKCLRPEEAAKLRAERWEDLHEANREVMRELARVAIEAYQAD